MNYSTQTCWNLFTQTKGPVASQLAQIEVSADMSSAEKASVLTASLQVLWTAHRSLQPVLPHLQPYLNLHSSQLAGPVAG